MAGTVINAGRWAECDVWAAPLGTTPPATIDTVPAAAWLLVGFLDPKAGVVKKLDEESNVLKAWGGIPIEYVSTFNGESISFTAIEDNDVVWGLIYQGSDAPVLATGVTTRIAKVPLRAPQAFLVELRNGTKKKRYLVAKGVVAPTADVTESEADLAGAELTITVLASSSNVLHTEQIKGYDS